MFSFFFLTFSQIELGNADDDRDDDVYFAKTYFDKQNKRKKNKIKLWERDNFFAQLVESETKSHPLFCNERQIWRKQDISYGFD